jgi:hypothetical protein
MPIMTGFPSVRLFFTIRVIRAGFLLSSWEKSVIAADGVISAVFVIRKINSAKGHCAFNIEHSYRACSFHHVQSPVNLRTVGTFRIIRVDIFIDMNRREKTFLVVSV